MIGEYLVYSVKIQSCRKDDTTVFYDQTTSIKILSDHLHRKSRFPLMSNQNKFATFDTSAYTAGRRSDSNFTLDGIAPFLAISSLTKMQLYRIHVVDVCLYKQENSEECKDLLIWLSSYHNVSLSVSWDQIENFALEDFFFSFPFQQHHLKMITA